MIHFLYPIYLIFQFLMTPIPVMHAHKIVPLHMFFPLPLMPFTIPRTPYPWDPKLRWLPGLHRHLDDPYSVLLEHLVHPSMVLIALYCTSGLICLPSPNYANYPNTNYQFSVDTNYILCILHKPTALLH